MYVCKWRSVGSTDPGGYGDMGVWYDVCGIVIIICFDSAMLRWCLEWQQLCLLCGAYECKWWLLYFWFRAQPNSDRVYRDGQWYVGRWYGMLLSGRGVYRVYQQHVGVLCQVNVFVCSKRICNIANAFFFFVFLPKFSACIVL